MWTNGCAWCPQVIVLSCILVMVDTTLLPHPIFIWTILISFRGMYSWSDLHVLLQGSSVGLVNVMPACSNAASADSIISTKTEPVHCFTARQGHSNLSFSGITGESSPADYQDCGASSMLLMGEPPWCPPCPESSFQSGNRNDAVMRYKEKKKTRK